MISYIGMQTQEVTIKPHVRVVMQSDTELLDEVVVVAYGTATKRSFTGSATEIKGDRIANKNPSELSKALTGEVAGVQVISTSGQPGSNASIRIRGLGSVNSSRAPLYVVDGIPFGSDLSGIHRVNYRIEGRNSNSSIWFKSCQWSNFADHQKR